MYLINTKTSIQISTSINKGNKTIYNNNPKAFNKMSISENSFSRFSLNRVLEIFYRVWNLSDNLQGCFVALTKS
jgi:hypothetical protein